MLLSCEYSMLVQTLLDGLLYCLCTKVNLSDSYMWLPVQFHGRSHDHSFYSKSIFRVFCPLYEYDLNMFLVFPRLLHSNIAQNCCKQSLRGLASIQHVLQNHFHWNLLQNQLKLHTLLLEVQWTLPAEITEAHKQQDPRVSPSVGVDKLSSSHVVVFYLLIRIILNVICIYLL